MDRLQRFNRQEKTGFRKWISSRYYDRPDGQDIGGKLNYTVKMAGFGGAVGGFVYTALPPPAMDAKTKLLRVVRVFVPSISMAVAFTCVTYYATNYRQKDDALNYALGGAAAGLLLGPATGMASMGAFGAILLAGVGYAKKSSHKKRLRLIPTVKQEELSPYMKKNWESTTLLDNNRTGNLLKASPVN